MGRFALSLFAVVGTIAVTSANTIPPTVIDYIEHQANKYWPVSQCPYLHNGGIRSYSASFETCKSDCNGHPECTAFHHHAGDDRCELKNCPVPAPEPTGNDHGWTGYSHFSDWKPLYQEFNGLGASPLTAKKRQQLLKKMVDEEPKVIAQVADPWWRANEIWTADVDYIDDGTPGRPPIIGMSAVQKTPVPTPPIRWSRPFIQFDDVASIPTLPNKIFLTLKHNENQLGNVIITLDGDLFYPRLGKQMLELATGNNREEGTWRGAGFTNLTEISVIGPAHFPQSISCDAYMGPDGLLHSSSLFPVEKKGDLTPFEIGQVRALSDQQKAGWVIITSPGGLPPITFNSTDPIIGHVTSGMNIIQSAIANGKPYVLDVHFSNAGLVIIDEPNI